MKCDVYVRKELYATVVVSGGTALFQGIIVHMTKELTVLAPFTREHLHCTAEREIVPFVKEELCYIACVFDKELKSIADTDREKTYELPDGNIITVGAERFHFVEVLFQPKLRNPRHFFLEQHEKRRLHPQGLVR